MKSVAREADDILLATDMIRLGARLQVLQAETDLSYDRLSRLYREIKGYLHSRVGITVFQS